MNTNPNIPPGPWQVETNLDDINVVTRMGAFVASTNDEDVAELLAAAPAILDALRRVADVLEAVARESDNAVPPSLRLLTDEQLCNEVAAARAAIAAATGEAS